MSEQQKPKKRFSLRKLDEIFANAEVLKQWK